MGAGATAAEDLLPLGFFPGLRLHCSTSGGRSLAGMASLSQGTPLSYQRLPRCTNSPSLRRAWEYLPWESPPGVLLAAAAVAAAAEAAAAPPATATTAVVVVVGVMLLLLLLPPAKYFASHRRRAKYPRHSKKSRAAMTPSSMPGREAVVEEMATEEAAYVLLCTCSCAA